MDARAKARARRAGALLALTLVPHGGAVAATSSSQRALCFTHTAVPEVGVRHERTCADVDALVRDVVSDARARDADAPDVPEDLARRCACAAAAFVCRQHEAVSGVWRETPPPASTPRVTPKDSAPHPVRSTST